MKVKVFWFELRVYHGTRFVARDGAWATSVEKAYKKFAYIAATLAERAFDMAPAAYTRSRVWFRVVGETSEMSSKDQELQATNMA